MVTFTIEFDKSDKKYKSGDTIRCELYIRVSEKFKARSLTFQLKGFAHTEWMKPERKKIDGKTVVTQTKYVGHEEYFKQCEYLLGSENGTGEEDIEVGYYHYKVSYKLPNNDLPSNIECRNGSVKYIVKAKYTTIDCPDKFHTAPFFVTSELDFNKLPNLHVPLRDTIESYYGLCCFKPRPLEMTHDLPRLDYIPGETIPITVEIDNHSRVRVEFIKVELLKNLIFMTTDPVLEKRTETKLLNEHFFYTNVPPGENKRLKTEFYLDPSYNWKIFNKCEIINCEYFVRSEAEMSGCNKNPHIITKVMIGTVPFNEVDKNSNIVSPKEEPVEEPTRPCLNLIQTLEDFNRVPPLVSVKEESELPTPSILGVPLAEEEMFNFHV